MNILLVIFVNFATVIYKEDNHFFIDIITLFADMNPVLLRWNCIWKEVFYFVGGNWRSSGLCGSSLILQGQRQVRLSRYISVLCLNSPTRPGGKSPACREHLLSAADSSSRPRVPTVSRCVCPQPFKPHRCESSKKREKKNPRGLLLWCSRGKSYGNAGVAGCLRRRCGSKSVAIDARLSFIRLRLSK